MRTALSAALLLVLASYATAQPPCPCPAPPQAPPVMGVMSHGGTCPCPAPPVKLTYEEARITAIVEGKPLVVGVGCEPPAGPWLTCVVDSFPGVSHGIVVSRPDGHKLLWLTTFHHNGVSASAVQSVLTPAPSAPAYYQPSPQYVPSYQPSYQPQYAPQRMMGGFSSSGGGNCGPSG